MYAKILVPLDGSALSEQVLPYARHLAQSLGAKIELLLAIDIEDVPESTTAEIEREGNDYLRRIAAASFAKDLAVDCVVEPGNPAEVILDRAVSEDRTLIAMSTHGYSGLKHWLLGSVAWKVAQASENPLLLVRATDGKPARGSITFDKVVVPLDGSSLAEQILPHVTTLGKALEMDVVLLRAYNPQFPGSTIRMREVSKIVHDAASNYVDEQARLLQQKGFEDTSYEVFHGLPALEIVEYANGVPDCMIAMCTHGRHGIGRWVLGSITNAVIHRSESPVLIIRASDDSD